MKARALLFVAFIVGLLFLMAFLTRWAQNARLDSERRQLIAQRERVPGSGGISSPSVLVPTPAPRVVLDSLPSATPPPSTPPARPTSLQSVQKLTSPIVPYLSLVSSVEKERQQVWKRWNEGLSPAPTPTPSPSDPPAPPAERLDLLAEAARWDKELVGSLPDSSCLPFHLAYRQYLALERDYMERLMVLRERGELVQLALLQQEREAQLSLLTGRLQGRLREIQLAHPDLPNGLKSFHIQ